VDIFGRTVYGYSGPVVFRATGQATVPDRSPLPNGSDTFSATLFTLGPQTLTVTDPLLNISGSQTVQVVQPSGPTTPTTPTTPATPAAPIVVVVVVQPPGPAAAGAPAATPAASTTTITVSADPGGASGQQPSVIITVSSSDSSDIAASIILSRAGSMSSASQGATTQGATGASISAAATAAGTSATTSFSVGGPSGAIEDEVDASLVVDRASGQQHSQGAVLITLVSFDTSLGSAPPSSAGGAVPLTVSLTEASGSLGSSTPFTKMLKSAAEGDTELSLLLFRLEGKPLRVGSSLADGDDSVLLVEAIIGPAGSTVTEIPVMQAPVSKVKHPSVEHAVAHQHEEPKEASPQPSEGVFTRVAAGGVVVIVVTVVWWWGWRPASRPINQTVR
jgi:hypothetical protein